MCKFVQDTAYSIQTLDLRSGDGGPSRFSIIGGGKAAASLQSALRFWVPRDDKAAPSLHRARRFYISRGDKAAPFCYHVCERQAPSAGRDT